MEFPAFGDAHVHLSLIDSAGFIGGGVSRVLDLGGALTHSDAVHIDVAHAHQFLTAPGGYPSRQSWTPPGSVRPVASATDAAAAVDAQLAEGASVIKITLNADAGPVFDDAVIASIVTHAHDRGVPVVAHAQGVGQAERAHHHGVDALAHTPFSELLDDVVIAAMAQGMAWISTLDIHGWGQPDDNFARASENLRRFHGHGGQVLYGTDLGNGPLPVGLNRREILALLGAGLSTDAVIVALTEHRIGRFVLFPLGAAEAKTGAERPRRVTVIAGERPSDPEKFATWVCTARAVTSLAPKESA